MSVAAEPKFKNGTRFETVRIVPGVEEYPIGVCGTIIECMGINDKSGESDEMYYRAQFDEMLDDFDKSGIWYVADNDIRAIAKRARRMRGLLRACQRSLRRQRTII